MAEIGVLSAKIAFENDQFNAGITDAERRLDGFGSSAQASGKKASAGMGKASTSMKAMAGAAAAGAAAAIAATAAIASLAKAGFRAADEQAKLARQLGVTTDQMAALSLAAQFAGVSTGEVRSSMRRLATTLRDAGEDGTRAADALGAIGLTAAELENMSMDDQLKALSEAMEGLSSQQEKMAVAQNIFGRSGSRMLLLLDDMEGTLGRAEREVQAFGLGLTGLDNRNIEAVNDNFATLGAATKGLGMQLAAALAPSMENITSRAIELAESLAGVIIKAREAASLSRTLSEAQLAAVDSAEELNARIDVQNERMREAQGELAVIAHLSGVQFDADRERARERIKAAQAERDRLRGRLNGLREEKEATEELQEAEARRADQQAQAEEAAKAEQERVAVLAEGVAGVEELLLSETERIRAEYDARMQIVKDYAEANAEFRERAAEIEIELEKRKAAEIVAIEEDAAKRKKALKEQLNRDAISNLISFYANAGQATAKNEKEQFEVQKNAATAKAIVSGLLATQYAYEAGMEATGNVVAAGVYAAIAAAGAVAQVAAIRSQSYGGGGSVSSPRASGSVPDASQGQGQQQQRQSTLLVQGVDPGQMFDSATVRGLIDQIAEAQDDGYKVVVA